MHLFIKLLASTCKLRDKNAIAVKKRYKLKWIDNWLLNSTN